MRLFIEDGHKIALAQSYAKNMGLYGKYSPEFYDFFACHSLNAATSNIILQASELELFRSWPTTKMKLLALWRN